MVHSMWLSDYSLLVHGDISEKLRVRGEKGLEKEKEETALL